MPLIHQVLAYLGLALAVSFDGLAFGAACSAKGTRIPPASLAYLSLVTTGLMSLSMAMGAHLSSGVSPAGAQFWGGVVLVALGAWQTWQSYAQVLEEKLRTRLEAASGAFAVIARILKEPLAADTDSSGVIDARESVLLGIALGMDAFAAGFGVSLTGFSWLIIPLVALSCPGCVLLGTLVGRILRPGAALRKCYALPGLALIAAGLLTVAGRL